MRRLTGVLVGLGGMLLLATLAVAASSDRPSAAGLTMALLWAPSEQEAASAVATAREAGLSARGAAFACGRAVAAGGGEIGPEGVESACAALMQSGDAAQEEMAEAFASGRAARAILAASRSPTLVPVGGSGGASGGRNE